MHLKNNITTVYMLLFITIMFSQEGIPVYTDYLSDNLYLVHPSMAGAASSNKIRLTARQQWFDVKDAPSLQTLNLSSRIGENTGIGGIVYTDGNGYSSQTGAYLTFAYHILFSRDRSDLDQLSFGLSTGIIQSKLDETTFDLINNPDPVIAGIVEKDTYFNIDIGMSYNFLEFYAHATIKNILPTVRGIFDSNTPIEESNNQRRYIFSTGYVHNFSNRDWSIEPSILFQVTDETKESAIDLNFKAYKKFELGRIWGGISYRRNLDSTESSSSTRIGNQNLQYITPFIGVNYKKIMFGYTYSHQSNSVVISNSGYHQLTLGYDFGKRKERYHCNCPAVN